MRALTFVYSSLSVFVLLIASIAQLQPTNARVVQYDTIYTFGGPVTLDEVWQLQNLSYGDTVTIALSSPTNTNTSVTIPTTPTTNDRVPPVNEISRSIRTTCPLLDNSTTTLTSNVSFNITSRFVHLELVYSRDSNTRLILGDVVRTFTTCSNGAASKILWFDTTSDVAPIQMTGTSVNSTIVLYTQPRCNSTWFDSVYSTPVYNSITNTFVGYPGMSKLYANTTRSWTVPATSGVFRYYVHIISNEFYCTDNWSTTYGTMLPTFSLSVCQASSCPANSTVSTSTSTTSTSTSTANTSTTSSTASTLQYESLTTSTASSVYKPLYALLLACCAYLNCI